MPTQPPAPPFILPTHPAPWSIPRAFRLLSATPLRQSPRLHGGNLVRTLRRLRPDVECVGFGGPRLEAAGCRLLYPLCRLAVMWFARVLANAPL